MPSTLEIKGFLVRIPDHARIGGGISAPLPPQQVQHYATGIAESLLISFQQFGRDDGSGGVDPRVRIRIEPNGIFVDPIFTLADQAHKLQYFVNAFVPQDFRAKCVEAISLALQKWGRRDYSNLVFCDQQRVWLEKP